jgi:hypothetical protein
MTTLCRRAFVSIAATIAITIALGACATAPSRLKPSESVSDLAGLLTIRFENLSRQTVDVYLIGAKREWILGRVAPGALANLRLPDEAFIPGAMAVRLAVLAGQPKTFAAARDPRALLTVPERASAFLSQRWTFSEGSLTLVQY